MFRYDLESPLIACSVNWESVDFLNGSYIMYPFFLGLVIPVLVIVYAYCKILSRFSQVLRLSICVSLRPTKPIILQQSEAIGSQSAVSKRQNRLTKMVVVMVGAFFFAWMPYAVVSLIVVFGGDALITASAAAVPPISAKTSNVYDPVIYVLTNPQVNFSVFAIVWAALLSRGSIDCTGQLFKA
nr:ciliary opsin [Macrobiotus sp.]